MKEDGTNAFALMIDKNSEHSWHRAILEQHYCKHRAGVSVLKAYYYLD